MTSAEMTGVEMTGAEMTGVEMDGFEMTGTGTGVIGRRPWWQDAVVYQIYPRSFADANGDGVGDLPGITERLDHIQQLGADAVWLSPIFVSPMRDFGYDVADYCAVDPVFGTEQDLDELIEGLHRRGMRLLLDWVPNHTSDQHPWFVESRSSRDNPKRDWYIWRDAQPDGSLPNNWNAAFKKVPAWTWDPVTEQYYLHLFLAEQPDLNWANPEVEAAMHATLRHWLDRGVDGFRADVVHLIGKGTELADFPEHRPNVPVIMVDQPFTHELLRRIRRLMDTYAHQPMMVGEVYLLKPGQTVSYLGEGDELHLTFDFRSVHSHWEAAAIRRTIATLQTEFSPPLWPTWVLSNHDQPRQRTRVGSDAAARAAAVLSLTMRGTPFLYAGEELGLGDAIVPEDRIVDPDGRDGCRAPVPWEARAPHGWGENPWLPFPPDPGALCAEAQHEDPASMLHLYRELTLLRRTEPALRTGDLVLADPAGDEHSDLVIFRREDDDTALTTIVNFSDQPACVQLRGDLVVSSVHGRLSAARSAGDRGFDGKLAGNEAVVLRT
jgi:alpha-glucosidase